MDPMGKWKPLQTTFFSRPLQIWFRESEEVPRLGAVNIDTRHPYMVHLTDRSQRVGFDKKKVCDLSCVFWYGVMINHVESGARYQRQFMSFSCVSLMSMKQPCLLKQPPLLKKRCRNAASLLPVPVLVELPVRDLFQPMLVRLVNQEMRQEPLDMLDIDFIGNDDFCAFKFNWIALDFIIWLLHVFFLKQFKFCFLSLSLMKHSPEKEIIDLVIQSDLFGMVKWPFQGVKWPPTRRWKGHFESPGMYETFWRRWSSASFASCQGSMWCLVSRWVDGVGFSSFTHLTSTRTFTEKGLGSILFEGRFNTKMIGAYDFKRFLYIEINIKNLQTFCSRLFFWDKKHTGETAQLEVWEKPQVAVALPRALAILWSWILDSFFFWGANTPLKTNVSPENQWLEDVFPTKIVPF